MNFPYVNTLHDEIESASFSYRHTHTHIDGMRVIIWFDRLMWLVKFHRTSCRENHRTLCTFDTFKWIKLHFHHPVKWISGFFLCSLPSKLWYRQRHDAESCDAHSTNSQKNPQKYDVERLLKSTQSTTAHAPHTANIRWCVKCQTTLCCVTEYALVDGALVACTFYYMWNLFSIRVCVCVVVVLDVFMWVCGGAHTHILHNRLVHVVFSEI